MTPLDGRIVLVTGGSRGFGRGIVEALAAKSASVFALARDPGALDQLRQEVHGVRTCVADVADREVAHRVLNEIQPHVLILNAGAKPSTLPIHEQSWEQFSLNWDTDVKATFHFCKEALVAPEPIGTVIIVSSRAAIAGASPLAGSYASAKRMQWFLAEQFQEAANEMELGIRFITLVPRLTDHTELGQASLSAFAARAGISPEAYLQRFGEPLTPGMVGSAVVDILTAEAYQDSRAFGFSEQGLLIPLNLPAGPNR